jgi:hypothetical protein
MIQLQMFLSQFNIILYQKGKIAWNAYSEKELELCEMFEKKIMQLKRPTGIGKVQQVLREAIFATSYFYREDKWLWHNLLFFFVEKA